eukprot:2330867-Amphidinium_carterae.2
MVLVFCWFEVVGIFVTLLGSLRTFTLPLCEVVNVHGGHTCHRLRPAVKSCTRALKFARLFSRKPQVPPHTELIPTNLIKKETILCDYDDDDDDDDAEHDDDDAAEHDDDILFQ